MNIRETQSLIEAKATRDRWMPRKQYSVFSQMDGSWYRGQQPEFLHKYRVFKAVAEVLQPGSLTELGAFAGASLDAFAAGSKLESYHGYDLFPVCIHEDTGNDYDPIKNLEALIADLGVDGVTVKEDLRAVRSVVGSDLVLVDADHSYRGACWDMVLAFEAAPKAKAILFDDYAGDAQLAASDAVAHFRDRVEGTIRLDYCYGGGLLILLR